MLYSGARGTMTPNNLLPRTARGTAVEPERCVSLICANGVILLR